MMSFFGQIAGKINRIIRESGLRELGQLEQDLVFGDAGMKEVIKFLTTNEVSKMLNKKGLPSTMLVDGIRMFLLLKNGREIRNKTLLFI